MTEIPLSRGVQGCVIVCRKLPALAKEGQGQFDPELQTNNKSPIPPFNHFLISPFQAYTSENHETE